MMLISWVPTNTSKENTAALLVGSKQVDVEGNQRREHYICVHVLSDCRKNHQPNYNY